MWLTFPKRSVIPGFRLTMAYTLVYLSLIVLIPLAALMLRSFTSSWTEVWQKISEPRVVASYKVTILCSLVAATINLVFGFIVAWTLTRYQFWGRKFVDAIVDLPFALPTAVSGIALTAIYAKNGWIGSLLEPLGVQVAFTQLGIIVALTFIGIPFVVRTLQPALEELEIDLEEAAASLGANRWQTFVRVILPAILPSMITGFALSFARALGEYGSVVFISGNMPMKTEITSLLIITKLEQYDFVGASAIATTMLLMSFVLLLIINLVQWHAGRVLRGA
ncbi:sulfate ABC transporter, inner membrane subunit CysT [Pirellula staleyi DSM 6068]|uniref:Sulfate transport system permease protein CysT n=1 Tax=Pirellula staleyi (strain ATCC 27377 / DSM 6068 / ICPB 4128) TaxID=530564 RepID=D2R4E9_PIRSD|nr:sulfate ABC transporter permease subunit CysT [Pirellula staleyi]ADB15297.1 sulfate ABC transporter, inner membrane subunit CysT [Pirellula staleyi DSM 6068]